LEKTDQTPETEKGSEESSTQSDNVTNDFEALVVLAKTEKVSGGEEVNIEPEKSKRKFKTSAAIRKKRRGYDKKYKAKRDTEKKSETPEIEPFDIIDKDVMKVFAGVVPFAILAIFLKDNKFRCTDKEKEILAVQWDNLLNSRLPDIFENYGAEFTLGLTISMFLIEKSGVFKPGVIQKEFEEELDKGFGIKDG